jgi:DNA-binding Lrp family transcriptional regulator
MDERDVRLLEAIAELETGSPERLHEETGIPVSTIHYRLNNLRDDGVIENDLYDVDLRSLGLGVTVVVDVRADTAGDHEEIGGKLGDVDGVTRAFYTTGETDFVVVGRLPDNDDVERLVSEVESVPAVTHTDSKVVMDVASDLSRPLRSYSTDRLVEILVDGE